MAATISGVVFDDLNRNGVYDPGEPGIAGAYVVLFGASGCVTAQTDAGGNYSFSVAAGTYTIYETVTSPNSCPPTVFTQPSGYNASNGPRKRTVTVTTAQATNGAIISGQNFSHTNDTDALSCDAAMIQFAGNPTTWYNIDLVTGNATPQGPLDPAHYVNAIGYNNPDHFLYGYDHTTGNLVRIDSQGIITAMLPNPTGLNAADYTTGCFDGNGFFYIYSNTQSRFYTVDLRQNSPTYMKLVNPTAGYTEQTSNYGTALSPVVNLSDWAVNPRDGLLYGVNRSGNVCRVVPTTGATTVLTTTGPKESAETSYGACGFDNRGNLYAIANSSGIIRKYTISGNTAVGAVFSQTVTTSNNDGAMCYYALIDVDYGDAPDYGSGNGPDNYNTLLASDGPRHALFSRLFLGTRVTAEADAHVNYDATGDDLTQGVPDDGVTLPLPPLTAVGDYYLNVTVTNETGETANLYGWIDFNGNGLFESNEAAPVISVPSQTGTQVFTLAFTVPVGALPSGHTFVRLRLTTDDLIDAGGVQDTRSVGPASDGEVEDYIIDVVGDADLSVFKTGAPRPVRVGELLTYTIVVDNAGPTVATNTILKDAVPPEVENPEYSTDGGANWQPWPGDLALGDLAVGEARTVLLRGIVAPFAVGIISNTATVTSDTPDPDPGNNTSTYDVDVIESADLAVTKSAAPDPVRAGETLTYTIDVTNFGPSDAQSTVVTDTLPAELTNAEYSTDGGATWQAWTGAYDLGTVAAGETRTLLVRGTVGAGVTGTIVNTVRVDSPTPDPDPGNNEYTVVTPVDTSADLAVTKTGSPKPVFAGGTLIYGIDVTNHGPDAAANVVLTDTVPAELTNVEYSTDGGTTWQTWTGSYAAGDLPANATVTVFIRGTVGAGAVGTITNTATASSDTPDPDPANNTDTDLTPIGTMADIIVRKTASPTPVRAGEQVTFTIVIVNAGPDAATNVVLADAIPSAVLDPEFAVQGSTVYAPWPGSYNVGTIASGASLVVTIRGTVDPSAAAGTTVVNTATATSDTSDPDPDNNSDTVEVPVETAADLSVVKRAYTAAAVPGELFAYTVTVTNNGPSDAEGVTLVDAVPATLLAPEYSVDGGATWTTWNNPLALGILAAGASRDVLLRGTVSPTATGSLVNTATVTGTTPDPDPGNNTSTDETPITPSADLAVTKTASPDPVAVGFPVTYMLVVQNLGPATAENVRLTDSLPVGTTNAEYSVDGGSVWAPWTGTYSLGDLPASSSVTVLVRATVTDAAAETLVNTATVVSDTLDPNPDNNTSTVEVRVIPSADLAVVKTAAPEPVRAGETLTYTITVHNLGPGAAQNVVVTDNVPAALTGAEYSADGGATWQPWTGSYNAGDLAGGAELTLLIRGIVAEDATGRIANTAVVKSDTPDPDPDNDSFVVETCICPGVLPVGSADLSVTKTAPAGAVAPGSIAVFTLTVRNAGPDTAADVYLYDRVPASLTDAEYSTDGGATWTPWADPLAVGDLPAGGEVSLLLRARVADGAAGTIENAAVATSGTPDPDPSNNTSSAAIPVARGADLALLKTAFPHCAARCETLFFLLTVANYGGAAAENVYVADPVPAGLCDVRSSSDGGATWSRWNGVAALGTIMPGTTATILLRGTVDACACGAITNVAYVSSSTPDADPLNNAAAVTVPVYDPCRKNNC